jgi:hypothetical protein
VSVSLFLLLAAAVAVAAFVQGTVGMGFALVAAPVFGLAAPRLLPAALLILMLPLNVHVAWRERSHLDLAGAGWITAGRTAGAGIGIWIIAGISRGHLTMLVGSSTLAAALVSLCAPSFAPGRLAFMAAGMASGVAETATGIGGPPLALVYQHHHVPILRSTLALCFAVGEIISLAMLFAIGQIHVDLVRAALALVPFVGIGAYSSQKCLRFVDGRKLRIYVVIFGLVSGLLMLLQAL